MRSIFLITFFIATAIAADPGAKMSLEESVYHCMAHRTEAKCQQDPLCFVYTGMHKAFEGLLCLLI